MKEHARKYRVPIYKMAIILFLFMLVLGFVLMIFDSTSHLIDYLYFSLAAAPLCFLFVLPFWLAYPYSVSPEGLQVRPTAFTHATVPWGMMAGLKPARLFYLRYVSIARRDGKAPLTLFLDVSGKNGLIDEYLQYAPRGNPLRIYLEGGLPAGTKAIRAEPSAAQEQAESSAGAGVNLEQPEIPPAMIGQKPIRPITLQSTARMGANWFFWIAALSAVNTASMLLNLQWTFIIGLSVTQVLYGFALGFSEAMGGGNVGTVFIAIAVVAGLMIAGLFVLFGVFARKRHGWGFITGMALYALDAILPLVFKDYLSFAFHLIALFFILTGYRALRKLKAQEAKA